MRPRASRIPGIRVNGASAKALHYSSKISKWLEDDHLVKGGKATNWKKQYKLRHNWARGCCNVSETTVSEQLSVPPLLARLHGNIVFTADEKDGLRAWCMAGGPRLLATTSLSPKTQPYEQVSPPTSLAIDGLNNIPEEMEIAVGFANGKFGIYTFDMTKPALRAEYMHAPSSNGTISAIAYASPYLLTMTEAQLLSLYMFDARPARTSPMENHALGPPHLLSSLKSHSAWPPLSLSIRASSTSIFASIAYSMPTYLAGWSVGLQEMLLTVEGKIIESRLASAQPQGFHPLSLSEEASRSPSPAPRARISPLRSREQIETSAGPSKPTSLSYSHPYLLAAHADNTLTLYMVISNAGELTIGAARRLWGHTSSVASAHVGDRGKAVSVSKRGNELRVWELEGGIAAQASGKRPTFGSGLERSVQVRPEPKTATNDEIILPYQDQALHHKCEDLAITKGWVAFDEEKVVVLREENKGAQALVVYDFT